MAVVDEVQFKTLSAEAGVVLLSSLCKALALSGEANVNPIGRRSKLQGNDMIDSVESIELSFVKEDSLNFSSRLPSSSS